MPTDPAEQEVSTEAQRQALNAMSAELVNKLNLMIEEQNARVQAFATQYPNAPVSTAPAAPPAEETPQPAPVAHHPAPAPQRSVPRPPIAAPRTETAPPTSPQPPAEKGKSDAPTKDKGENSIGCGKLVFIIAVIVILLRCCN